MDSTALGRAGGWAAIVGGAWLIIGRGTHVLAPDDSFEPVRFAGLPHEVWHLPTGPDR